MKVDNRNIESHLKEKRLFKPLREFAQEARIKNFAQYQRMYRESIKHPDRFWTREANELVWRKRWRKVVEWKPPFAKWFIGGQLNLSENCLDRHLTTHRRNKAAAPGVFLMDQKPSHCGNDGKSADVDLGQE